MFCFLQIFCEINFNSEVIVKSITNHNNNFKLMLADIILPP